MFMYFLKIRYTIDYNIWNMIEINFINLNTRYDRLVHINKELLKLKIYNPNRYEAIKPEIDDINKYKFINQSKLWKNNDMEYLRSALGCKISHFEILKKYVNSDKKYLLIIEDDAVFENNTIIYLNMALHNLKDIDWDILYLSSNLKKIDDVIKVNINLLKVINGLTTTAQLFKIKNIPKIINIIENSENEIDNTYNNLLENKYCVYPMCVYQTESYSDINNKVVNYEKFNRKFKYI